jgi:hypothetical protein
VMSQAISEPNKWQSQIPDADAEISYLHLSTSRSQRENLNLKYLI